ncbi:MAG: sensor histidine kinase [Cyanobacteria bacterium J06634_6]
MTASVTQTTSDPSPSIYKILKYVEWAFLSITVLRMLFPLFYEPLGYEVTHGDYIVLLVFLLFAIFSVQFPIHRPLWQKRAYLWIEIGALIITRLFTHFALDLFLWLVFVKSCFLLGRREVIFTVIAAGVAWQIAFAQYFFTYISRPIEEAYAQIDEMYAVPKSIQVADFVLNGTAGSIAINLLIILLSLTIISERKIRQQAANLSQEVEALAADLERTRIARDIHDSLGHTLTTLDIQLEVAQTMQEEDPQHSQLAINRAKQLSRRSLEEVRRAVSTMRDGNFNLSAALTSLISQVEQTHACRSNALKIETEIGLPYLPLQVSQQLFLIMKEGLNNIQKHSQASVVKLWAQSTSEGVALGLSDNGIGFSLGDAHTGFGLRSMQERVQLLDGKMTIHSAHGKGTLIQVTIPQQHIS